jgi:hypothetical protein
MTKRPHCAEVYAWLARARLVQGWHELDEHRLVCLNAHWPGQLWPCISRSLTLAPRFRSVVPHGNCGASLAIHNAHNLLSVHWRSLEVEALVLGELLGNEVNLMRVNASDFVVPEPVLAVRVAEDKDMLCVAV